MTGLGRAAVGDRAPTCTVTRCTGPHRSLGYCEAHYRRYRRYGTPLGQPARDSYVDEIAVARTIAGDPPARLTQAEREEAVRRMHARGLHDRLIAERLGVRRAWASRIRRRLDLPAVGTPGPAPGSRRAA